MMFSYNISYLFLLFSFVFYKIIIQACGMIKNKVFDIKIIFKIYLKQVKNFWNFQIDFYFTKHQIIVFKNHYQKLIFRTILEKSYQKRN